MNFAFVNIEQVLAWQLLDATAMGILAIALLTSTALMALPDGAAAASHPVTLESFAKEGVLPPRLPSVMRVMHVVQLSLGVLVPFSWLIMGIVVVVFLDQYVRALPAIALLGAATCFVAMPLASNASLLAVGLHRRVPWLMLSAGMVKVVAAVILVRRDPSVTSIAVAGVLGSMVYAAGYLRLVARAFRLGARASGAFLVEYLAGPFVVLALAVFVVIASPGGQYEGYWQVTGVASAVAVVALGAYYRFLRRRRRI
ncbi:hypothetical protein [Knoellia sinensis]|uniref:hypothetical protein n=1 Tax=Knoellia sinensis TaxID=136100 RepID=UPI0012EC422B|nr:hypothetical protein [Knoellia sinensis]